MLEANELVTLLRQSMNISKQIKYTNENNEEVIRNVSVCEDKAYLDLTDEDIILYLRLCASRDYQVETLGELPVGSEYPLVLLTQVELFKKLAVSTADWIDMGADNNNYLKRSQRFSHYMSLAEEARAQYNDYIATGGTGGMQTFTTRLKGHHMSDRDYGLTPTPRVYLRIVNVYSDSVEIAWDVSNVSHFGRYKVYIGKGTIIDRFLEGSKVEDKVTDCAVLIKSTDDIRNNTHRISGLEPNTEYHVAVISIEKNTVWGMSEKTFVTPKEIEDEDNVDIDTFPDDEKDGGVIITG